MITIDMFNIAARLILKMLNHYIMKMYSLSHKYVENK